MEIKTVMPYKRKKSREILHKDRVDLRSFPYKVCHWPKSEKTADVIAWLRKNVGTKLIDWTSVVTRFTDNTKIYFTYEWRFKRKEDLILFKLAWLYNE